MATANKGLHIIVDERKYCTPCKKSAKVVAPNYFCIDCDAYYCDHCFEFHSKIPLLTKHIALKGEEIDVWANLPYKCLTHDKTYEFFCGTHKLFCCHVCVSLQHTSCENMEYIPEKAKYICTKSEFTAMKKTTEVELKHIQQIKSKIETKTKTNMKSKETFIKHLKDYRAKLNGLIDSLERTTLGYMDKKYLDNNSYIKTATDGISEQESKLELLKQQLDSASSEKEVLVFICLKRGEKLLADLKQELLKLDTSTNREDFQLVINSETERFIQNLPDLGKIEDEQKKQDIASDSVDEVRHVMFRH